MEIALHSFCFPRNSLAGGIPSQHCCTCLDYFLIFLYQYWWPVKSALRPFVEEGARYVILQLFLMNSTKWRQITSSNKLRVILNIQQKLEMHQNPNSLRYFKLASCCYLGFIVMYYLMQVLFPMCFPKLARSLCNRAGAFPQRRVGSVAGVPPPPAGLQILG